MPDITSAYSAQNGEWYQQDDLTNTAPTVWNIAYPYASLGGSDDSAYTMFWRIHIPDNSPSTAAYIWQWGDNELGIQRYLDTLKLKIAGGSQTIATGVNSGDEFSIFLTRNSATNALVVTVNGVATTLGVNVNYTTFNTATSIQYHPEVDQRGEGIGAFYCWVDRLLTDGEIQEITSNPYQLFKSSLDTEQEYALNFSVADETQVTMDAWNPSTLDFEFEVTFIAGSTTRNILGSDHTTGLYMRSDGALLYVWYNSNALYTSTPAVTFVSGNEYRITGKVNVDGSAEIFLNGASIATRGAIHVLGSSAGLTTVGYTSFAPTAWSDFKLLAVKLTDFNDPTNSRLWEFNQASNTPFVKDHYNGAIAELVGFPTYSGFVRAKVNKFCWGAGDGLEFNSSQSQYVTVDFPDDQAGTLRSVDSSIKCVCKNDGVTDFNFLHSTVNTSMSFVARAGGNIKVGAYFEVASGVDTSVFHEYEIRRFWDDGANKWVALYIDGELVHQEAVVSIGMPVATLVAQYSLTSVFYSGNIKSLSNTDRVVPSNSRYYDFTKIRGSSLIVPETLNGQDGTMVGWTGNGIFVPEKTKTLVGQKFDGSQYAEADAWGGLDEDFTIRLKVRDVVASGGWAYLAFIGRYTLGCELQLKADGTLRVNVGDTILETTVNMTHFTGSVEVIVTYSRTTLVYTINVNGVDYPSGTAQQQPRLSAYKVILGDSYTYNQAGQFTFEELELTSSSGNFDRLYSGSIEAGNQIKDTSGNNNHGTVVGGELKRVYDYSGYGELVGYRVGANTTLPFPPANQHTLIEGDVIEFEGTWEDNGNTYAMFLNFYTSGDDYVAITNAKRLQSRINGYLKFGTTLLSDGDDFVYKLEVTDTEYIQYLNGVEQFRHSTTVAMDAWLGFSSTGEDFNFEGQIRKCTLSNSGTLIRNYDFTTGDETKIIETINSKHAIISGDSAVGFQPIVPVEVFTVGADVGSDYINVGTGLSAQQNPSSDKHTHFKVTTDVMENAARYIHNNSEVNWQITVEGNKEYNGSDDSVFKVAKPNDRVNFSFYDNKTSIFFKRLQVERPKITAAAVSVTNIAFERCVLDGLMLETYAFMAGSRLQKGYMVKDSKIRNFMTSADEGYTTYLNSIVIDCSGNYSSYSNIGGSASHVETYATDTLSVLTSNHYKHGTSTPTCFDGGAIGSNNISNDASAVDAGIGTQEDMTGWFDANYQLTEAGQTATKGKGRNGSDLTTWAYASEVPAPPAGASFTSSLATSFDLYASLLQSQATSFDLMVDGPTPTVTTSFDLFEAVTVTQATSLDVYSFTQESLTTSFDLYAESTQTQATTLDLYASQKVTNQALFDLYGSLTAQTETTFDLYSAVAVPQQALLDLYASEESSHATSFDLYGKFVQFQAALFDMGGQSYTGTLTTTFDLYAEEVVTQSTLVALYEKKVELQATSVDLYVGNAETVETSFDMYNATTSTHSATFDLYSATIEEISAVFSMYSETVAPQVTSFDLYKAITEQQGTTFDVYSHKVFTQVTYFDLGATVQRIVAKRSNVGQNTRNSYMTANQKVSMVVGL